MHIMESAPGAKTVINGKEVDYFCGCGYFGFQGHREIIQAACQATCKYGLGSATSRQGYGNNPALLEAEKNAASFFGTDEALYYVSGYLGNSILLQGLSDDYDIIFIDRESHYSVFDGTAVAKKPVVSFNHRDADDLKIKLQKHLGPSQKPLVISDGVFAVSGQIAPIPDYLQVLEPYESFIICVDDAHATGVIGKKGHGCFEYHGISDVRLFSSGTLSKALGGYGGIIAGDAALKNKLLTKSKMTFSSSPPPIPAAAASALALDILRKHPELRKQLWENVAFAKNGLRKLGFSIDDTPVPIICLSSNEVNLEKLPQELLTRNIVTSRWYAGSASYSSVPRDGAIRIAIFATHSKEQLERLIDEIKTLV
ncbi:MAG: pyridoxal phosphate-dependent aminotransferase family protein [Sedimentisphaerales bacterium]|nr:pyridoxal phosphate-dependent aminotransferase family protein [Sedimentisphaerales bacterium]